MYEVPTFEELREAVLDDYDGQFDGVDRSEHSDTYAQASVLAALAEGEYAYLDFLARQVTPLYAEGEYLDRWAEVFGLTRRAAAQASGSATATGTPGSQIADGRPCSYVGGQQYLVDGDHLVPESGEVEVDLVSVETGEAQNRAEGDGLAWDSPPAGIDGTLTVVSLEGGRGAETDDELRTRILLRTQNTPGGGNATDWQGWALGVSGVDRAWVLSLRRGLGTVDVVPLGPAGGKVLSETVRQAVEDELEARRPLTCDLSVVLPQASALDVVIEVLPASGHEFDWSGSKEIQAGSDATTLVLDSVEGLSEGDRVVVGLEQREIASINGLSVTLLEALSEAPSEGSPVYPGGPLYEAIRDAVQAYFEALDPLETWYLNACEATAHIAGVKNQTITAPAADQELVDDPEQGPPMHVLGSLLVLEAA
jgi:uncharacterized phage protein gp47/JayE